MKNILGLTNQLFDLEVNRQGAISSLKKKFMTSNDVDEAKIILDEIDQAIISIYGEPTKGKADWEARVLRLRELVKEDKSQKDMAIIVVAEGLFGGMATAKQCMPYIKMAQEWSKQEMND